MQTLVPPQATKENDGAQRVLIIDILRAIALLGIIINHLSANYLAGPSPAGNEQFNIFSPIDKGIYEANFILTFGKFFTIFSFLFGLSFALQLDSTVRKGGSFALRFLWRLVILFAIGYVHNLFYSGDILVIYALLGVFLLPARFLGNKVLLPLALLLIFNTPLLIKEVAHLNDPAPTEVQLQTQAAAGQGFAKMSQEQFRIKQSGTLKELVSMNAIDGLMGKFFFQVMTGRLWITVGLFLLGLYAGRKKVFEPTAVNMRFFKRLLIFSGLTTVISTILALFYGNPFGGAQTALQVIGNFSFSVHQAALSSFYVAGIVLLYWKTRASTTMQFLAPLGQMGLTTYLMQSVFGLALFYGIGLGMMDKIGVTASLALGVLFFFLQVIFAKWWMSRYRFGMVEWVWRSATYLRKQPMQKSLLQKGREVVNAPTVVG